jgi:hypothetical protein
MPLSNRALGLAVFAASACCAACAAAATPLHDPAPSSSTGAPAVAASPAVTASPSSTLTGQCTQSGQIVSTASDLSQALASATPGTTIRLTQGTYSGNFVATTSGTSTAPITLCGPQDAVIDGGSISSGYAFYLNGASWWNLIGFTVEGGQKGVVTDHADHVTIAGLYVHDIGDEGIHLRSFSSDDTVKDVVIRRTGLHETFYGEGIYVGSAHSNWCRYTNCNPDASNDDVLQGNDISETTAENIDIKEGTTGGTISGNQLSGVGMVASAATAWVNVKGNQWTVSGNVGMQSLKDGFQVHQVYPGWGVNNSFQNNVATVDGPGYGFYVQNRRLGTTVACNNVASGAGSGLSNIACT